MKNFVALSLMLLCGAAHTAMASPVNLTLDPPGVLIAPPGSASGWGFTFDNDANFAVLSFSTFSPGTLLGGYVDYIPFQFEIVGPNLSFNASLDLNLHTGLGEFDVSPSAVLNSVILGTLTLFYDLYSVSPDDPDFNPDEDLVSLSNSVTEDVAIVVQTPEVTPAPEPLSGAMAAVPLLGILGMRLIRIR